MTSLDILKNAIGSVNKENVNAKKEEEVEIVDSSEFSDSIDADASNMYKKIKNKKIKKVKENISEWNNRDFANYIAEKYKEKYKTYIDHSVVFMAGYFPHIKKAVDDTVGNFSNQTLKDYIDYFFDHWVNVYKAKNSKYWFSSMKDKNALSDFAEYYDSVVLENRKSKNIEVKSEKIDSNIPSLNDVEGVYILGGLSTVLIRFGVLVCINYMIIKKKYDIDNAYKIIYDNMKNMDDDKISKIKQSGMKKFNNDCFVVNDLFGFKKFAQEQN